MTTHVAAAERARAGERFFAAEAERIAVLSHRMAERFARGGRLLALGETPPARSDARHVAVEFVHPVIVGKRALPALALTREGGALVAQLELAARPDDMAIAFGEGVGEALGLARSRGCLTIGFAGDGAAEYDFAVPGDDSTRTIISSGTLWDIRPVTGPPIFRAVGTLVEPYDGPATFTGHVTIDGVTTRYTGTPLEAFFTFESFTEWVCRAATGSGATTGA